MIHEEIGERRADHGATAKTHDRLARCHATPVRKPFDQRRNRRDIAKAKTNAANDAGTDP